MPFFSTRLPHIQNQWASPGTKLPNKKKDHTLWPFLPPTAYWPALIGQTLSALRSAARQYLAAVSVGHSFSEAMLLFPMELLRLISPKHEKTLLSGYKPCKLTLYMENAPSVNLCGTWSCEKKPKKWDYALFFSFSTHQLPALVYFLLSDTKYSLLLSLDYDFTGAKIYKSKHFLAGNGFYALPFCQFLL